MLSLCFEETEYCISFQRFTLSQSGLYNIVSDSVYLQTSKNDYFSTTLVYEQHSKGFVGLIFFLVIVYTHIIHHLVSKFPYTGLLEFVLETLSLHSFNLKKLENGGGNLTFLRLSFSWESGYDSCSPNLMHLGGS